MAHDPPSRKTDGHPPFDTPGATAAARWLTALGLSPLPRWYAEISVAGDRDTRFDLSVYAEEWGFSFQQGSRASWIRITDIPFAHGRDEFSLLSETPELQAIVVLMATLEARFAIQFERANATVQTNLPSAVGVVREWFAQSLPLSSQRRTVELCGDEMHAGMRCHLGKGHNGQHQHQGPHVSGVVRWASANKR